MKPLKMKTRTSSSVSFHKQNRKLIFFLVTMLVWVFPVCAMLISQPQTLTQLNRDLQVLRRENMIIERLQVRDTVVPEAVPENTMQFMPNQTYVARSGIKKISGIDRATYNNLAHDLRNKYSPSDLKMIPETYIQTGSNPANQLVYKIGFESKLPLEYLHDSRLFEGSMKFILLPESPATDYNLSKPVLIEVVSDYISGIDPAIKEINHLSIPLTEIKFRGSDLTDSAQIKIITKSNPEGYKTFLKVKPAIELTTKRTSLQGLGVQKIPVSIRLLGSSAKDSFMVSFNPEKGTVDPQTVFVHAGRPTVVTLRSEGLGPSALSASSGYRSNELNFNYTFPWLFILMAVIGGTLGALGRYYVNKETDPLKNIILKGIILGFLGSVVYYVLGYSLIELKVSDIFNEFAVLGFSALVALLGIKSAKQAAPA